jgi:hypothetical protein
MLRLSVGTESAKALIANLDLAFQGGTSPVHGFAGQRFSHRRERTG